jgi:hypothetical protein
MNELLQTAGSLMLVALALAFLILWLGKKSQSGCGGRCDCEKKHPQKKSR